MTEHMREEILQELDDVRGIPVPAAVAEALDEGLVSSVEDDLDLPLDPRIPAELAEAIAQSHSSDDLSRLANAGLVAALGEIKETYRDVTVRNVAMSAARYVLGLKPLPQTQQYESNQAEGEQ